MRFSRAPSLLLFIFVAALGLPTSVQAWTRTVIKTARATVDIERDATLSVLLRLDVVVDAGWLHELELVGLGTGVELDRNRPPYLRSEGGEVFRPESEVHEDGRVHLSFPRREAPRRGEYRAFIRYRTSADAVALDVEGAPRVRVIWSVPAWETGLHDVAVEFRAPRGTSVPTEAHELPAGVDFHVDERPDGTVVEWRRIHLPRMTPWPLTLDVPVESAALPATVPHPPEPTAFRPLTIPEKRHPLAWPLLLLAVLALVKRRSIESKVGRERLWIRLNWVSVMAIAAMIFGVGQWLAPNYPVCAIPLIGLIVHRRSKAAETSGLRDWRPAADAELAVARISARDFLDATTAPGLMALLAGCASLIALGQPTTALLLLPMFLAGARLHAAPTAAEATQMLRAFASNLRLPGHCPEMCFAWELSSEGAPRLRVHLRTRRSGLLSVSFMVCSSALGFVRRRRIMLLVETRAQSDADDHVRQRASGEPDFRSSEGSILRLIEWEIEALELLRVLARENPMPVKVSRGTWLLRQIAEPGRKAA
jgi:hypothetical protein